MAIPLDDDTDADVFHRPGLHRLVGDAARKAARQLDPRLQWEVLEGNLSLLQARVASDEQPHARSLDAIADDVEAGMAIAMQPVTLLDVLAGARGMLVPVRVKFFRKTGAPEWLIKMASRAPQFIGEDRAHWPAVEVSVDDTVRRSDDQARW